MPTGAPLWYDPLAHRTTLLHWAYCWQSPWISKANGSVLNATEVSEYFEAQATGQFMKGLPQGYTGSMWSGSGLDECLSGNSAVKGEEAAAAAGFRAARRKFPNTFMGAWGGQPGEQTFRELMQDGTFSVAMIEGYSYCPGDKWCFKSVHQYYPFLDWARAGGYLNRTVFCFGMMIGQSALNPNGWTPQSLRTEMLALKKHYPEMAGVLMCATAHQVPVLLPLILPYGHLRQGFLVWSRYGQPPNSGFANSTNQSTPQTEMATLSLIRAANQLMAELWPDRDEVTTRY